MKSPFTGPGSTSSRSCTIPWVAHARSPRFTPAAFCERLAFRDRSDGSKERPCATRQCGEQLLCFVTQLGAPLLTFAAQPQPPQIGVTYSSSQSAAMPSLISETKWIKQPGCCRLATHEVFVWCSDYFA